MLKKIKFILFVLFFFQCNSGISENIKIDPSIYGEISPFKYLTGRFSQGKHSKFVLINDKYVPTNKRKHYLRKDTAIALRRMYKAFHRDYPRIKFFVRSSTRNFYSQKGIWERKWTGKRLVGGKKLNKSIKDEYKRGLKILEYSSMPGTSRHHWGTDFDINSLNNSYYKSGDGRIIFRWLKKNAYKYGFGQPYISGRRKGYNEERWHWSYLPVSKIFLKDWNTIFNRNKELFLKKGVYLGSNVVGKLAPVYVNSINKECK
jgi:zinc D-Ala-D-Ala carboxypeptidase